jgi:hypothetical protein
MRWTDFHKVSKRTYTYISLKLSTEENSRTFNCCNSTLQHQETISTELQPRLALPVGQKWNYSHALATGRYGTTLIYDDPIHV